MLTLFKKLFGRSAKKTVGPLTPTQTSPSPAQMQFESAIQMAKVEVAKLSLKAIAAKFPEDIRALLNKAPDDGVTVALPIQTILKQLPQGVVRMSLASLHRQAPAGLFKPMPAGDKRMVEVPLVEVFKHVKPTAFKRRNDQRAVVVDDDDLELPVFNSRKEPTPETGSADDITEIEDFDEPEAAPTPEPSPNAMRVVAPPSELSLAATPKAKPVAEAAKPKAVPAKAAKAKATAAAPVAPSEPTLVVAFAKISESWSEAVTAELTALDPATNVAIPHSHIAPGLARGKITCTWKQLQGWLTPPAAKKIGLDPETALVLPLKLIAPAFLASTRTPSSSRKSIIVDESIPALFSGGRAKSPEAEAEQAPPAPATEPDAPAAPVAEAPITAETTEPKLALAPSSPPEVVAVPQPPVEAAAAPAAEATDAKPEAAAASAPTAPAEPTDSPATAEAPASAEAPSAPTATQTIGDILGEPERTEWTPSALVNAIVKLPGVAGAIVALQEGFQVAHALPDGVNPETISAFLPQIFTRLNQYAGEMKLGEVDDLLFTTRGAHCLIYRLGTVYLAVLGKPGESLPWNALRLAAAELSRQVKK